MNLESKSHVKNHEKKKKTLEMYCVRLRGFFFFVEKVSQAAE